MTAAISGGKRRSRSEGESDRSSPEHSSSPAPSTRSSTKQQIRHRASIACASCRERRIRCVVGEGESECAQCRRTGSVCIIKDDDERRRPISKAYMSSLSNRITLLEDMLKERGVVPPPAVHPPKTRHEAQARLQQAETNERSKSREPQPLDVLANHPPTPPASGEEDVTMSEPPQPKDTTPLAPLIDPLLLHDMTPKPDPGPRHILCARGTSIFDPSAGRSRFFGPTANSHVYAPPSPSPYPREPQSRPDQAAARIIAALRPSAYDHLMRCFWEHYNPALQIVDEVAFEAGRVGHDARFYSSFLHLAMLATGYMFAEWEREDMKGIVGIGGVGGRESNLHRELKGLVEGEMEEGGGVPMVQGLLLLSDLESGVGRDGGGWMYSGMANRLAFDIGLHVNPNDANESELEIQARSRVMAACVMFDRKWALLLGRPTTIKIQDIGVGVLPAAFGKTVPGPGMEASVASQMTIHRQIFELMELAGKVADFQNSTFGSAQMFSARGTEDRAYLHFIGLERLFHNWYRRLPEHLAWKPANIKTAPMGFFTLHQQFHVCMVLLHRPWAKYGPMSLDGAAAARYPSPGSPGQENDGTNLLHPLLNSLPLHDNRASLSRSMCTQHAIRVARIFWHHRQRFDGRKIGQSAIQHAGTAALALMAALAHKSAELDHQSNLRYLQVLSTAIYDMSHVYQPAARMYTLLKTMLVEIRSELIKSGGFVSTIANRYQGAGNMVFGSGQWGAGAESSLGMDSLEATDADRAFKRRRLSSQSSVDMTCLSPSVLSLNNPTCLTPPGSSSYENPPQPDASIDSTTFDLDFFHASFVDFINCGGSGQPTQDWTPPPTDLGSEATKSTVIDPTLTTSESPSQPVTADTIHVSPSKPNEPQTPTPPSAPAPDAITIDDDDTTADKTIEDWLAEPTAAPSASTSLKPEPASSELPTIDLTTTSSASTPNSPSISMPPPPVHSTPSHANPDGTPICRDPYVLSLETELGLALGLDAAATNRHGHGRSASVSAGMSASGMEWVKSEQPPPQPMTPVTLDELVQSVEEAVGSARARARARARSVAVGSVGVGGGAGASGGMGEEGVGRNLNRELDFLAL